MRKLGALLVVVALMSTVGCQSMANGAPGAMPLDNIATSATYDVGDPVQGEAEGWILFGFFALGVPNQGSIGGGSALPLSGDPVKGAAEFDAITNAGEGADAILSPRHHSDITSYIIAKKQKTRVWGRTVHING